ncbi:xylulokinase [Spirilliplanes yamanashiensis]|uniref:Xylulose kinase n=1 Tax=Spirilliplanes yamanashiensis TaxID=42233 RepID=A0A8J3YC49_9ACTN|nr:xylulokinase [Spirilliplanes yamanashiensis]MDP9816326.1 xylulokinase [Spirilliplanes yamanashiensis]GIJ05853.1 xylulokinase [Spirilliplanes yamanashiensis]
MTLVAGIDSSTQSCKVVVRDAESGELVRQGRAAHPDGTEVHPDAWWAALGEAIDQAGGLDDVAAASVAGQQHGMVTLDEAGEVVRPALLWNDTRSAGAAAELIDDLGGGDAGRQAWVDAVGIVPVASFTLTKLRWLARTEPDNAARAAAVCLPHDWLTWKLAGAPGIDAVKTDRSDASGTLYWSAAADAYRPDLLELGFGRALITPEVLGPTGRAGSLPSGAALGPGAGDNAAAGLGAGALPGDVVISIGTSGTVFVSADVAPKDPSGTVAGFADTTGRFLPIVVTLNAARVLDAAAKLLGVGHDELSALALSAPAGADGLVLVPYLEGERTPNRPDATGAIHGLTLRTSDPAHLARAAVEGMLCALADGLDALVRHGAQARRVVLVGGGARSEAVRRIAPALFGLPVLVPPPGEYVADGAARQAAWVALGSDTPPTWASATPEVYEDTPVPLIREQYAAARDAVIDRRPT